MQFCPVVLQPPFGISDFTTIMCLWPLDTTGPSGPLLFFLAEPCHVDQGGPLGARCGPLGLCRLPSFIAASRPACQPQTLLPTPSPVRPRPA
eukprot:4505961-Karenia_brevis.AAC.1